MNNKEIAVLVPCYNEELTIAKVVTNFKKVLPEATIYVYDNNSKDDTDKVALKAGAVVYYEYRQGKGNVIRSMFRNIDADCYIMIDGDNTYPADHAREIANLILENKADMVIGDRLSSTYFTENKRAFHNFGNKAVRFLINKLFKNNYPKTIIVEPNAANCIYNSAKINDGKAHNIYGDLKTIMVGLACGVPNPIAWPIIRDFSTMFVSCDDAVAARGVRILANPVRRDEKIISGESGAAGIGAFSLLMGDEFKEVKEVLGLNKDSVVLFFNTEGDTDPVNYGEIIWNGKYRMPTK